MLYGIKRVIDCSEHGYDQAEAISRAIFKLGGVFFFLFESFQDFRGNDRVNGLGNGLTIIRVSTRCCEEALKPSTSFIVACVTYFFLAGRFQGE